MALVRAPVHVWANPDFYSPQHIASGLVLYKWTINISEWTKEECIHEHCASDNCPYDIHIGHNNQEDSFTLLLEFLSKFCLPS